MSKDFWYPWYPALFKADTRHLTAEQDGIYRRLLDEYMETREPLPDSDIALSRIAGVNENNWLDAKRIVIAFFTHKNGMYFHKKCDQELDIQDKKSLRRILSAEKAAKKRWSQHGKKTKQKQKDKCDTHAQRNAVDMRQDATVTVTVTEKNKYIDDFFERWWGYYPDQGPDGAKGAAYKGSKKTAKDKFKTIAKKEKDYEVFIKIITKSTREYKQFLEANPRQQAKHAVTWLNQRCFEDDYAISSTASPGHGRSPGNSLEASVNQALSDTTRSATGQQESLKNLGLDDD